MANKRNGEVVRIAVLLVAVLALPAFFSCSKTDRATRPVSGSVTAPSPHGALVPEIVSASCYPENPTVATPIIAQYKLRDAGMSGVTYTFRWYVDNALAQEGPLSTLDPGKAHKGSEVYVEITAANAQGAGTPVNSNVVRIGNLPPSVTAITLTPTEPSVGTTITATAEGTDPDGDRVTFTYRWFANGVEDETQKGNTFSTRGLKKKDQVAVAVTASDGEDAGKSVQSDILVLINSAPKITSIPPTSLVNGSYTYQVVATDPDNDALTFSLENSPSGMTIDPVSGLIRWDPPKTVSARQELPIRIKVDDGDGGTATQAYSLFLEMK